MKYLGIDYGTKKIGLAVSDSRGKVAFPHAIIPTAEKEKQIEAVIAKEGIEAIVLGESLDLKGQSNKVQEDIKDFAAYIGLQFGLPVHFMKEFFSSSEARHSVKNERQREKPVANPRRGGKKIAGKTGDKNGQYASDVDAQAAAVILQRYLDTIQLDNNG